MLSQINRSLSCPRHACRLCSLASLLLLGARAGQTMAGTSPEPSSLHWLYILVDVIKLGMRPTLGLRRPSSHVQPEAL